MGAALLPTTTTMALVAILMVSFGTRFCMGGYETCKAVCKQTSDEKFCLQVLSAAIATQARGAYLFPTIIDIQVYLLIHGQGKAFDLSLEYAHSKPKREKGNDAAFAECRKLYKESSEAYASAYDAYIKWQPNVVREKLNLVLSNGASCLLRTKFDEATKYEERIATISLDVLNIQARQPV